VVDREGVVRLRVADGRVLSTTSEEMPQRLGGMLDALTAYNDAGTMLPAVHVLVRDKIVNLAGLPRAELVISMAADAVRSTDPREPAVIVAEHRG
jgi:hypothetical protein